LADKVRIFETARHVFRLNESQCDAVASCISATKCSEKPSVRLIWGPPGTGKTKTLSVILLMLLMDTSKPRILVCAPTNSALVQLASRLISLVENFTKTSHLLDDIIMFGSDKLSSCFKNTDNDLSKIFLKFLVNKLDIHHHRRRDEEDKLLQKAQLVFCTPFQSIRLSNQHFDILVIDEAAYLKESESMVPLTIDGIKHLVLVGDEKQLDSVVLSPVSLPYNTSDYFLISRLLIPYNTSDYFLISRLLTLLTANFVDCSQGYVWAEPL
jgi:superfamily I DNA and/or RNA helicase